MLIDTRALIDTMKAFNDSIIDLVRRSRRKVYGPSGLLSQNLKEWYGAVSSSDALWSVDYSSAGFTEVLFVEPQLVYSSSAWNDQCFASLSEYNTESASGRIITGGISVLGGSGFRKGSDGLIMVKVVGI